MGGEQRQDSKGADRALEYEEEELEGGFDVDDFVDRGIEGYGEQVDAGFFGDELDLDEEAGGSEMPEGEAGSSGEEPEKVSPKVVLESVGPRLKASWASLLSRGRAVFSQAKEAELPGDPEGGRRRFGTVAAICVACLLVGAGAFFLAKGSGEDVEQARLEGEVAGRQAGAIEGAAQGYRAGFRQGRRKGFRDAYVPAYQLNYKRAFEQAGLDVPTNQQIDVPLP